MLGLVVLFLVTVVLLTIGTLAWWWIGDQWADAEHRRFGKGKRGGRPRSGERPRVVSRERETGDG